MKKIFLFLALSFVVNLSFSQSVKYIEVFQNFKENYNSTNFEKIFNDFSEEMKTALPLENTRLFFVGLKFQAGNIKEESFLRIENGSYAVYKTIFEKTILTVNISIDDQNKINGLYLKPFVEEGISTILNGLTNYPTEIAKSIYDHSKDLPNKSQLSIAIIHNGGVNYYGVTIENDTLKPIENQDKIFEIGSITKVFTASVLTSLVIDNKIKLNDFVNTYYSYPFKGDFEVDFLSLANHTSGLPRLPSNLDLTNTTNPYMSYGDMELDEYLSNLMNIDSGAVLKYMYSNLGAGLLGHTLGLSQEKSFNELLQDRIFNKYEMNNSFTSLNGIEDKIIKGLDEDGKPVSNWEFDVLFGGGGILSTTEDLVKFANAHFNTNNKELELTRKPTFDIDENMKIGLGWHILKSEEEFNLFWHNGGTGGYSSSFAFDVEKNNGVIILSNVGGANNNIDTICFELMRHIKN